MLACAAGIVYAQALSNQQVQDLQGQLSDDQSNLSMQTQDIQADNNDMNTRQVYVNELTQRINDAEYVLNAQSNSVNAGS